MRKIVTLFLILLAVGFSARAKKFTFNVDNPAAVEIIRAGSALFDPLETSNEYDSEATSNITVRAKEGFVLKMVKYNDTDMGPEQYFNRQRAIIRPKLYEDGTVFSIETSTPEAIESATATLTVDNASAVRVTLSGNQLDLVSGKNTLKFDPLFGNALSVSSAGPTPIYRITDGEDVRENVTFTEFSLTDGCEIDIVTKYPEGVVPPPTKIYIVGDVSDFRTPEMSNYDFYQDYTLTEVEAGSNVYYGIFLMPDTESCHAGAVGMDYTTQWRFYTALAGWDTAECMVGSDPRNFYIDDISYSMNGNDRNYSGSAVYGPGNWGVFLEKPTNITCVVDLSVPNNPYVHFFTGKWGVEIHPKDGGGYWIQYWELASVDDVAVDKVPDSAVYNLQGVKVADSLSGLPAGLYISGGKKISVK